MNISETNDSCEYGNQQNRSAEISSSLPDVFQQISSERVAELLDEEDYIFCTDTEIVGECLLFFWDDIGVAIHKGEFLAAFEISDEDEYDTVIRSLSEDARDWLRARCHEAIGGGES